MGGFEVAIVLMSVAAGAGLAGWHYNDKWAAIERERKAADALRKQAQELRISAAYRKGLEGRDQESVHELLRQNDEEIPQPLLFGAQQERDLRAFGRAGVKRTDRRAGA